MRWVYNDRQGEHVQYWINIINELTFGSFSRSYYHLKTNYHYLFINLFRLFYILFKLQITPRNQLY